MITRCKRGQLIGHTPTDPLSGSEKRRVLVFLWPNYQKCYVMP